MIKIKRIMICLLIGYSFTSSAQNIESDTVPVRDLIMKWAELHGTNFVVSQKVRGNIELFGTKVDKMSQDEFVDLLEYSDFISTRKDGVVYVFTRFEVEHLGEGVGPIWQG